MNVNAVLGAALVLNGVMYGSSNAADARAAQADWQMTLRDETTNGGWMFTGRSLGIVFYWVPAGAAKILESRSPSELLPFLAQLRSSPSSWNWKAEVVDQWSVIARKRLHGTPYIITIPYAILHAGDLPLPIFSNNINGSLKDVGLISTNWIRVYKYTDDLGFTIRSNAAAEEQDILTFAEKNPLDISVNGKIPKYGDPNLVEAEDQLRLTIPQPWTVLKMLGAFEKLKGTVQREYVARVLAASRDPRAAVILCQTLEGPDFGGRNALESALFDYFVREGGYGLPPERRISLGAGSSHPGNPSVTRWWAINKSALMNEGAGLR